MGAAALLLAASAPWLFNLSVLVGSLLYGLYAFLLAMSTGAAGARLHDDAARAFGTSLALSFIVKVSAPLAAF